MVFDMDDTMAFPVNRRGNWWEELENFQNMEAVSNDSHVYQLMAISQKLFNGIKIITGLPIALEEKGLTEQLKKVKANWFRNTFPEFSLTEICFCMTENGIADKSQFMEVGEILIDNCRENCLRVAEKGFQAVLVENGKCVEIMDGRK